VCFEVIKKTRGQYEHRTHKREADQDKVFRTNRLKSNCAISEFFSRGYDQNPSETGLCDGRIWRGLVLIHSLAGCSSQTATLVVCPRNTIYFNSFHDLSSGRSVARDPLNKIRTRKPAVAKPGGEITLTPPDTAMTPVPGTRAEIKPKSRRTSRNFIPRANFTNEPPYLFQLFIKDSPIALL
jgi:hypothetical protein